MYNAGGTVPLAVDGVGLTIAAGTVTALRGPSGSGKTTLLSLASCAGQADLGPDFLGERELTSLPERFLTGHPPAHLWLRVQQFNLIKGITVLENVMLPRLPHRRTARCGRAQALELLDRLGLADKGPARVEWLSGGEAQRTAIAQALINTPAVLIADEPTAHLDTALSRDSWRSWAQLKGPGHQYPHRQPRSLVRDAAVIDRITSDAGQPAGHLAEAQGNARTLAYSRCCWARP